MIVFKSMPSRLASLLAPGIARIRSRTFSSCAKDCEGSYERGGDSGLFFEADCSVLIGISVFLGLFSEGSISARISPTFTFACSSTKICSRVPDSKAGTSATILSVSTSSRVSPRSKLSPSERFQVTTIPSSIVSPSRGSLSSVLIFFASI